MARIVVIEDNPHNMELMTYLLQAFGHQVIGASTGSSGVAAVRREWPDLVLSDLQLPGTDGFGVARELKSDTALRDIPLVAVTASNTASDRAEMRRAGFDGCLDKPIDPQRFVAQAERFLRGAPEQTGDRQ
jgi:two-component system, cell cycle response regulator